MTQKIFDILVIGSGLSSMIFSEEYLKKKKCIDIISPDFELEKNKTSSNTNYKTLPPQIKKKFNKINDYFEYNKILFDKKNCNILGTLEFGGLSNYWGLQLDKNIKSDLISPINCKTKKNLIRCFKELLIEKKLLGKYGNISNDYKLDRFYEMLLNKNVEKKEGYYLEKSILGLQKKSNKKNLYYNKNENIIKLVPKTIFKNIKKKIKIHNFFVENLSKKNNFIHVHCSNKKKKIIFITKKLVLACGTIVSTKLVIDYLQIKKEVPIMHHPRLTSVYFGKNKIRSNLEFTPGLLHIKTKEISDNNFTGDLRPLNRQIINTALNMYSFFKPLKFIFLFLKEYIFFSNTLLGSSDSNLFMKKKNNNFIVFSKKNNLLEKLKKKQKKIFFYLQNKKIIYPFFKNFFPGVGGDYHYFGTLRIGKKSSLSVNQNCQLKNNKSIYIIDGSVFNFKNNMYPLGIILANAKRIAKFLS